jgi:antitoxin component YwqK of YwqJK toxin-antitoxin module
MKFFNLIGTIMLITACNNIENELKPEIRIKYFPGDTVLKHIISFNSSGLADGLCFSFYKNGKLRNIEDNKEGKLNGEILNFFENGRLESKSSYKDGKKDGIFYGYYPSGNKRYQLIWKDDIRVSYAVEYGDTNTLNPILYWEYDSLGQQTYKAIYNKEGSIIIQETGKKR